MPVEEIASYALDSFCNMKQRCEQNMSLMFLVQNRKRLHNFLCDNSDKVFSIINSISDKRLLNYSKQLLLTVYNKVTLSEAVQLYRKEKGEGRVFYGAKLLAKKKYKKGIHSIAKILKHKRTKSKLEGVKCMIYYGQDSIEYGYRVLRILQKTDSYKLKGYCCKYFGTLNRHEPIIDLAIKAAEEDKLFISKNRR